MRRRPPLTRAGLIARLVLIRKFCSGAETIKQAKNSNDKDVCYFADLPGYGYAKMSKDKQRTIEVGVINTAVKYREGLLSGCGSS